MEGVGKFVPRRLLEYLAASKTRTRTRPNGGGTGDGGGAGAGAGDGDGDDVVPRVDKIAMAAVLVADVSGFTALEEKFARERPDTAVDDFSAVLNSVLGGIEAIVWSMGGCVVHVAGDALICAFTAGHDDNDDDDDGDSDSEDDEHAMMEMAEEAARRTLAAFETVFKHIEPSLDIHGSVSWGELDVLHLGGGGAPAEDGRGATTEQSASASSRTGTGTGTRRSGGGKRVRGSTEETRQLTICGEAMARALHLLDKSKRGEFLLYRGQLLPAESVTKENAGEGFVTEEELRLWARKQETKMMKNKKKIEREEEEGGAGGSGGGEKWQSYVPEFFRARASGGYLSTSARAGGEGGGEGRGGGGGGGGGYGVSDALSSGKFHICSMFAKLADFHVARRQRGKELDLEALNWSFNVLRREVHRLGGCVDVLLCDDKGFIFKAVFGLAGASVNDCEMRGVLCALRCLSAFRARNLTLNMGLAAGEAFLGAVKGGSECYDGFTMLSSVGVTLAARLMMKADPLRALCSTAVHACTRRNILYQYQNRWGDRGFALKGMEKSHGVFQPVAHAVSSGDDRFLGETEQHEQHRSSADDDRGGGGGRGGGSSAAHVRRKILDVVDTATDRLAARVARRPSSSDGDEVTGGSEGAYVWIGADAAEAAEEDEAVAGEAGTVIVVRGDTGMGREGVVHSFIHSFKNSFARLKARLSYTRTLIQSDIGGEKMIRTR